MLLSKIERVAKVLTDKWLEILDQRTEKGELIISKEIELIIDELYRCGQEQSLIATLQEKRKGIGGRKKIRVDGNELMALLNKGENKTQVAKKLNISRKTLNDRIEVLKVLGQL